jgi:predicted HTH transcriptional regulator
MQYYKQSLILSRQESETLEFKESLSDRNEAGESLVAFANKNGGTIYFGIKNI